MSSLERLAVAIGLPLGIAGILIALGIKYPSSKKKENKFCTLLEEALKDEEEADSFYDDMFMVSMELPLNEQMKVQPVISRLLREEQSHGGSLLQLKSEICARKKGLQPF